MNKIKTLFTLLFLLTTAIPLTHAEATLTFEEATKLANQGDAKAQTELGNMYVFSKNNVVKQDFKKAVELYTFAAEQGYAPALYELGTMYDGGYGVEKNKALSVELYIKSAEQGYSPAQHYLGISYDQGDGVPRDYEKAFFWYKKANEQGNLDSKYNLAMLYLRGEGTEKNESKAVEIFKLLAAQGDDDAVDRLNEINQEMLDQIIDFKERTQEYYEERNE